MKKGVTAVVAASILYGIMPALLKMIMLEGMNSASTVFFRMFFAAIFAFIYLMVKKEPLEIDREQFIHLAVFGAVAFGATSTLTTASYNYISTGLATMLQFTYPLFVTIAMWLIFKERLTKVKLISCLMALAGLALMADFSRLSPKGIILATLSGVTYAIYVVASNKSRFARLDKFVVVFYINAFASVIYGARAVISGEFMLPTNLKAVILLMIVALFCTVMTLYLLSTGIRLLGASTASVLNMLEPITSVIVGIVLFKDAFTLAAAAGCVLVVMSSIVVALFDEQDVKVKVHANTARYR